MSRQTRTEKNSEMEGIAEREGILLGERRCYGWRGGDEAAGKSFKARKVIYVRPGNVLGLRWEVGGGEWPRKQVDSKEGNQVDRWIGR